MANFYDNSLTQKVTGTVHIDNYGSIVPVTGTVAVQTTPAFGAFSSVVTASVNSCVFVEKNTARKQLWIYNSGSTYLFLNLGAAAGSASHFVGIEPDGYWELPVTNYVYVGAVHGAWASGTALTGSARIVEIR